MSRPEEEDSLIPPRDVGTGAPLFAEPWHAEVLALAHGLTAAGVFSAGEWADALGAALREATAAGRPDDQATYHGAALVALERLLAHHGRLDAGTLDARTEEWRRAYLNTPHGQPVELAAGRATHDDH